MKFTPLVAALAVAAFTSIASASSVTTYDTTVTPQDGSGNLYYGSGNPNGGFTVSTNYGTEIGLRADYRSSGTIDNTPTNTYGSFVTGPQTTVTSNNNGARSDRAAWSFDISVDVNGAIYSTHDLADYTTTLTISDNIGDTPVSFDFLGLPDNGGPNAGVAQNSQNIAFYPANFNMNNNATYTIGLSLMTKDGTFTYNTDSINVVVGDGVSGGAAVAPLPASFASGGLMLLGFGVWAFKKRIAVA